MEDKKYITGTHTDETHLQLKRLLTNKRTSHPRVARNAAKTAVRVGAVGGGGGGGALCKPSVTLGGWVWGSISLKPNQAKLRPRNTTRSVWHALSGKKHTALPVCSREEANEDRRGPQSTDEK